MKVKKLHSWNLTVSEAMDVQRWFSKKIVKNDDFSAIKKVCGVDVGYNKEHNQATAACVVMSYPSLEIVEEAVVSTSMRFQYIPGLLSFREAIALIPAFEKLKTETDLLICDGHGLIHPRRFGLACHVGLLLEKPAIGCAKSRLTGTFKEPGKKRGSYEYVYDREEPIGAVLRTKDGVRPVFVSIGHRISLSSAIEYILGCTRNHRLTEPIRIAHMITRRK